jgi:hypothetical protein
LRKELVESIGACLAATVGFTRRGAADLPGLGCVNAIEPDTLSCYLNRIAVDN